MEEARQNIKYLRSSIEDLRRLFERSVTTRNIAEPFASFDDGHSASEVQRFLQATDYDLVGVRLNGIVQGYALRSELGEGRLGGFTKAFEPKTQIPDSAPMLDVFELLRVHTHIFVTIAEQVWGIVTRGDLHKAPVRMWIFSLISLVEMHAIRIVRDCYPGEEWIGLRHLPDARLEKARDLFKKRKARNEQIDPSAITEARKPSGILLVRLSESVLASQTVKSSPSRHPIAVERRPSEKPMSTPSSSICRGLILRKTDSSRRDLNDDSQPRELKS